MDVIRAHEYSSFNREILESSKRCGCFYCLREFKFSAITSWTDNGETACCPYCEIDSVIGDNLIDFDKEFLQLMHDKWFAVVFGKGT